MTQLMEEQREGAGGEQGKNGGTMKVKEEQTEGEEQTEEAGTRLVKEEQREEDNKEKVVGRFK